MKLLFHMCCAPCSVYPVKVLSEENMEFEGFFYNPNIHPQEEFLRRKENVERLAALKNMRVEYDGEFLQDRWQSFEGPGDGRCTMCYALRMDRTAEVAKKKGFDAFTTSLLVSPYQKHELIKELGEKAAGKHGVEFYYRDFRPGFREGQQLAKEMELYRQKYCGCILSLDESDYMKRKSKQKGQ